MPVFRPPSRLDDPPVIGDLGSPLARRLRRWYKPLAAGINVILLTDGTVIPHYATDDAGAIPGTQPYDPYWGSGQTAGGIPGYPAPVIKAIYYGGHDNVITAAEAATLTAAGFGPFIS